MDTVSALQTAVPLSRSRCTKAELEALHRKMGLAALRRRRIRSAVLVSLNVVMALFILFPLLYAVSVSLMPGSELFTMEMNLLPKHPDFTNYLRAWTQVPLVRFIFNSFLVSGCITLGQIITCSLAAFAFSFLNFKGKNLLFLLVMATMMVPGEATIISNYLTVSSLGILDSYLVLILPSLTSAMGIFLFRQNMMQIPLELKEASTVAGVSEFGFFWKMTEEQKKEAGKVYQELFDKAVGAAVEEDAFLLVMDEFTAAYNHGMVNQKKALAFLKEKPEGLEVALTGRDPAPELLELADYVSEIRKVKHPFDNGLKARKGIEL